MKYFRCCTAFHFTEPDSGRSMPMVDHETAGINMGILFL